MTDNIAQAEALLRRDLSRLNADDLRAISFAFKQNKASLRKLLAAQLEASQKLAKQARQHRRKQYDTSGLRPDLRWLTDKFIAGLDALTGRLRNVEMTNAEWEDEFQILLAQYGQAGYLTGSGQTTPPDRAVSMLVDYLDNQFSFLSDFALEIQDEEEWREGWGTRAESYALSIKDPYWNGEVKMLPLPAMPGDGTSICLNNCKCVWQIDWIDEDEMSADATWVLGEADHCQTCLERADQWTPLEIRGGVLQ